MELEEIHETIDNVKGHIYIIKNIINKKVYIGQTYSHIKNHGKYRPAGYKKRFASHISEAIINTKKKQCTYLNNAIRKYGKDNFSCELIKECNLSELDKLEKDYIIKYNSLFPNGYNLTIGGKGTMYVKTVENNQIKNTNSEPYKHSNETKAKISQRLCNILSTQERRTKKSLEAQDQHNKARLLKYKDILLQDDLTKYIRPIIKKNTNTIYKYEININNIISQFYDGKSSNDELYTKALNFLTKLKEQNNNVNGNNE